MARSLDLTLRKLETNDNEVIGSGSKTDNRNLSKKSKNAKSEIQMRLGTMRESIFLTSGTKKVFNQLR